MSTREICTGAPAGFEAECGAAGPHGTHDLMRTEPQAHPMARVLRGIADAIDDGLPVPYSIDLNGLTPVMYTPSRDTTTLEALRKWGSYLSADEARCVPHGNGNRDKYTVHGTLPDGAPINAWDALDPPGGSAPSKVSLELLP